ncbi:RNA-guided endonuclease TnpB family protein [Thermosphaera sp.]
MPSGNEGALTLTIKMRVIPEPDSHQELLDLMKRYRDALNYSIRVIIDSKALSLGKAHKLLYNTLKERFDLPSKIAQDCYREALAIAKSWLRSPNRGRVPTARNPRLWLTHGKSYRVYGDRIELLGGLRLRIIGWDGRYDGYPNGDVRLVYRSGKFILYISKRVPRPAKYAPREVLAVDINEKYVVVGNSRFEYRFETAVERALWYKQLAERLQKKYSLPRYNAWLRRSGVRRRVAYFHRKARNIVEDWAKKTSHRIVVLAMQNQYAVAREDLTGLIESLRKLPKDHRVALMMLSYRKLEFWLDWQAEKHGVPAVVVEPKGTSTTCPRCNTKMRGNGYRVLKCPACSFEADRDTIAVLNIERKTLSKMWGSLITPNAP